RGQTIRSYHGGEGEGGAGAAERGGTRRGAGGGRARWRGYRFGMMSSQPCSWRRRASRSCSRRKRLLLSLGVLTPDSESPSGVVPNGKAQPARSAAASAPATHVTGRRRARPGAARSLFVVIGPSPLDRAGAVARGQPNVPRGFLW